MNLAVGASLATFLWWSRPRMRAPARLRLRMGRRTDSKYDSVVAKMKKNPRSYRQSQTRSLNVQFIFNGHNFDAHEVLGIPAGCGKRQVEEAYMNSLRGSDNIDRVFIEQAYQAIIQKISS